jgi:hypothetical protein
VDAWGNQIRDLRHYEVVVESTASESKLHATFSPKGEAVVALASGFREDGKVFLADGSRMGIGVCVRVHVCLCECMCVCARARACA